MQLYLLYSQVNHITTHHGCYTKRKLKKLETDTIRLVKEYFETMNLDKSIEEQVRKRIEYLENFDEESFGTTGIYCWNGPSHKAEEIVEVMIQAFIANEYMGDYYD